LKVEDLWLKELGVREQMPEGRNLKWEFAGRKTDLLDFGFD